MPTEQTASDAGGRARNLVSVAFGVVGASFLTLGWLLNLVESRTGLIVRIGSVGGFGITTGLFVLGGMLILTAGILQAIRAFESRHRALRIVACVVGPAMVVAAMLALTVGAWVLLLASDESYTDLGTTADGHHLVASEIVWTHTSITIYEQDGLFMTSLTSLFAGAGRPFADGDYQMFDNGDSVALVWSWSEDGQSWSDSDIVPLDPPGNG